MKRAMARGGTALVCLLALTGCSGDEPAAGVPPSATASPSPSESRTLAPVVLPDTQKVTGVQSGWTIQVPVGWVVLTPETIGEMSESELVELAEQLGYEAAVFRQLVTDPTLDVVAFNPDAVEEIRLTWYPSVVPLGTKDYAAIVAELGGSEHTTRPLATSTGHNTLTAFSDEADGLAGRMMVGIARKGTVFLILSTDTESKAGELEDLLVRGVTASP